MVVLMAHSQAADNGLSRFAGNVHQFNGIFPQEKVYLMFDNVSYSTGDTVWFKAYVAEASRLTQAPSKVLYVDLLSARGYLLKQLKLKVQAGQADGYLTLSDETAAGVRGAVAYPGGYYEVRAYTSNMLNFSEDAIFSRVLPVYDLHDSDEATALTQDKVLLRKEPKKGPELEVSFFPEGGGLVKGLPCHVAFKAVNSLGLGVDVSGYLSNGTQIGTTHDGMGQFTIVPDGPSKMTIEYNGKQYSFYLPLAQESGYVLSVKQSGTSYAVQLSSNNVQDKNLALVLMCRGQVVAYNEINSLGREPVTVNVPKEDIPEGVCQFVLYDTSGDKLCTRMVYNHSSQQAPFLSAQTDKEGYSPFEKIRMSVSVTDCGSLYKDRLCISVRDGSIKAANSQDDLRSYMLLASDLRGLVNKPGYYFEADDDDHRQALDLLMMVQGWERYEWESMSGQKRYVERHRMEDSLTLNGWVLSPYFKRELDNVTLDAIVIQPDTQKIERFSLSTSQGGYFGLDLSDFYGDAIVKIWTTTKWQRRRGTDCRLLMERSELPSVRPLSFLDIVNDGNADELMALDKASVRRLLSLERKKDKVVEREQDTEIKSVTDGFVLPDVSIFGRRQFVNYDTFKAYDAAVDMERDKDKGQFTTDLEGYLISKGLQIRPYDAAFSAIGDSKSDCARYCPPSPVSFGTGGDTRTYYSGGTVSGNADMTGQYVEFRHVLPQQAETVNSGNYADSWVLSTDMDNIKAVYVFDEKVKKDNLYQLTSDFQKASGRNAYYLKKVSERKSYDFLVVELKPHDQLKSRTELYNIGDRNMTVRGFTRQEAQFYSPQYPDGAVPGEVDYRRTLYWNPNVITDDDGKAVIEFYNNSYSASFHMSAAGMTAGGTPYILNHDF